MKTKQGFFEYDDFKLKFTFMSLSTTLAFSVSFLIVYSLLKAWIPFLIVCILAVAYLMIMLLLRKGHIFPGKILFLIFFLIHIAATGYFFSTQSGFHFYIFIIPAFAGIGFDLEHRKEKIAAACILLLSISSFMILTRIAQNPLKELSQPILKGLNLSSILFSMICLFFGFLYLGFQLQKSRRDMIQLIISDPLTGIFNRREFLTRGEAETARSRRYGNSLTFLMVDIDHFKKINDTWGHASGDLVLKELTQKLESELRNTDCIGRLGGEEFGILLPETREDDGIEFAERLRSTIENHNFPLSEKKTTSLTISIGVSCFSNETDTIEKLSKKADEALYQAKANGRNRVAPVQK